MATTTRCARCGREIRAGAYLCEQCREEEGPSVASPLKPSSDLERRAGRWPPWIPKPSPVQYHATVMITVFLVVAGLAAFAFLSHRGVGPFEARADRFTLRPPSTMIVDASVTNDGSKTSRANCRIIALYGNAAGTSKTVLTDPIEPGETVHFEEVVRGVSAPPTRVRVDCA